jgi:hypothetical protein
MEAIMNPFKINPVVFRDQILTPCEREAESNRFLDAVSWLAVVMAIVYFGPVVLRIFFR